MKSKHFRKLSATEKNAFYFVSNISPDALPYALYQEKEKVCKCGTDEEFRTIVKKIITECIGKLGYMLEQLGEQTFDAVMKCDEEYEQQEIDRMIDLSHGVTFSL